MWVKVVLFIDLSSLWPSLHSSFFSRLFKRFLAIVSTIHLTFRLLSPLITLGIPSNWDSITTITIIFIISYYFILFLLFFFIFRLVVLFEPLLVEKCHHSLSIAIFILWIIFIGKVCLVFLSVGNFEWVLLFLNRLELVLHLCLGCDEIY